MRHLLLACALVGLLSSGLERQTLAFDWAPATPAHRLQSEDCEPWHCAYQDGDTLYCFLEGEQIETPGATFVCHCEAQGTDGCTFALLMTSTARPSKGD